MRDAGSLHLCQYAMVMTMRIRVHGSPAVAILAIIDQRWKGLLASRITHARRKQADQRDRLTL